MYILNISKLGSGSTGMLYFSFNMAQALKECNLLKGIVCAKSMATCFKKYDCPIYTVPDFITSNKKITNIKPFLWLIFSFFYAFKFRNNRLITTTHHMFPFIKRQIICIHDLRAIFYPDSILQKIYFNYILRFLSNRAEKIFTVSNTVKNKIAENYYIDKQKIHVLTNVIDKDQFTGCIESDNDILPLKYILCVGANWRHKNIHNLLINSDSWSNQYNLKIVCGETDYFLYLKKLVLEQGLANKVRFYHKVSFELLKKMYKNASTLVYPSVDEGFGLPPLEAMSSGTPAIVSDIPVFREVLGDAAIYVDPDNCQSWKDAFSELEGNYSTMVERGLLMCKKYSFDAMKKSLKAAISCDVGL